MRGAAETEVVGKVIAIELNNKPFYGERERAIYDGLPTSYYENLVTSIIRNAADVMEVSALLIEVPGEEPDGPVSHKRVNISAIREITKS